jgi:hypothetical protein
MTETRKLRVFLCHSSQDKPIVRELYQRLNAEGWIDPWLDEEKLLPGHIWDMEIEKAVEAADVAIVCLSNNSINKEGYIQKELRFVLDIALEKPEGSIFIIPLKLEECQIPRRLRSLHFLEYFPKEKKAKAFRRLIEGITNRANDLGIGGDFDHPRYQTVFVESDNRKIEDYIKMKDEGQTFIAIHVKELNSEGRLKAESVFQVALSTTTKELFAKMQTRFNNSKMQYKLEEIQTPVASVSLGNFLDHNSIFIYKPT